MKKILLVVLCFFLLVSLVSCKCKHEWEAATCEKPQTCLKCGEQQGEALGHKFGEVTCIKEPTCANAGLVLKTCSVCGTTVQSELPMISHTFSAEWTMTEEEHWHEATCVHSELTQDKGKHEWDDGEVKDNPTCDKEGSKVLTCVVCGQTKKESIPATGHIKDAGVVIKEPTCSEPGEKLFTCTVCGQTITENISATGEHSYVNYKCSVCGLFGKGPAGGYVFYDKGSYSDGWRYLEAAPESLSGKYAFGYYRTSDTSSNELVGTSKAIGSGKANTEVLVKTMGESTYTENEGSEKGIYAAMACMNYSVLKDGVLYADWFMPSYEELSLMYESLYKKGLGSFSDAGYWSSSEHRNDVAWMYSFKFGGYGGGSYSDRWACRLVHPIRAF